MEEQACVVILNWNGQDHLRDCLRSVLDQTYPRFRVLLVDNGSTDQSPTLVEENFPEVMLLALPENVFFARGTNAGIRQAVNDPACRHVVTLNNDTRVAPEWLAELVKQSSGSVGMVASKLLFMDRPNVLNSTGLNIAPDGGGMDRGWNQVDEGQFDMSHDVFGPTAGAALYRRDMLDSIGLFDEEFVAYYEDLDLAWRARLAGWQSRFAPGAVVYHKFSMSHGRGSARKTYFCERNRIWNFVQNYPWRYAAVGIPWAAARTIAGPLPWSRPNSSSDHQDASDRAERSKAMVRARLDAYAGVARALAKRGERMARSRASSATIGSWFRRYGTTMRDAVLS